MKGKKKVIVILAIILCLILIYFLRVSKDERYNDDIIFFKNFYFGKDNKKDDLSRNDYIKENTVFLNNNSIESIGNFSLFRNTTNDVNWNELIYPGTKGEFHIYIFGNEDLNYKIEFESKNEKPKNLMFNEKGREDKFKTLEELSNTLIGDLNKGASKDIVIQWEWVYENAENDDIQDTEDGKTIKEYNFDIIVRGEEKV